MTNAVKQLCRWSFFATLFAAANSGFAQKYSVVDLGEFTNSLDAVSAINSPGQFVGALKINGFYRAVLYGGAWTNLGTLGGTSSFGLGMNDALRVVGRSRLTNGTVNRAFLWTPGGTDGIAGNPQMKDLGTLSGGAAATADDINNSGQIAGYSQTSGDDNAYRYSGGTMSNIGTLLGNSIDSYSSGINDAGHVTGYAYYKNFSYSHAFFYNGSSMTDLGVFSTWHESTGLAINKNDQIVGYVTDTSGTASHAFRYASGYTDLGTLGGGHFSYARSINNSNIIVGGSYTNTGDTIYHAFICTNTTLSDLNNQVDDSGAGWVLNEAWAINDSGQIIGLGTLSGMQHAFLLAKLPPVITNQPSSQTVALSNNVTFTAGVTGTTPLSYQWRFNGTSLAGATTNYYALNNAQPTNAGNYTIVVTNSYGSVTSAVATLTVGVPPSITNQPVSQAVVVSNNVTFTAGVTGTPPLSYQWQFNGTSIAGATANFYSVTNVQATNAGNYTLAVTNNYGAVTSAIAVLTVNFPPSITNQPVSQSVLASSNVTFTAGVTGTAPLNYQWRFNGANLAGATANFYSITNVQATNAGNYTLAVTNNYGAVTSAVAVLTVNFPPSITNQPVSQSVVVSNNVTFTAGATGTAPLNYQWQFNGTNLAGATASFYSITNAQATNAGNYTLAVTNNYGAVTSVVATLTVNFPPSITNQPVSQSVVVSSNVTFTAGVTGTPPLSYQWQFNGTNLAGATTSFYSITNAQATNAGNYTLAVTNN